MQIEGFCAFSGFFEAVTNLGGISRRVLGIFT